MEVVRTFKLDVNCVEIDAGVTGSQGDPVRDLTTYVLPREAKASISGLSAALREPQFTLR